MSWLTRTLLAADPALLLKETELALHHIRQSSSPFLLFGLSKHLPASDLSQLVSALQTCTRNNVGFLCDQPSTREFHVSLAAAPTSIGVVPFRSTLRGKPTIALGRELRPGLLSERDVSPTSSSRDSLSTSDQHREEAAFLQTAHDDWHQLWGSTNHVHTLPIELQNLPYVLGSNGRERDLKGTNEDPQTTQHPERDRYRLCLRHIPPGPFLDTRPLLSQS